LPLFSRPRGRPALTLTCPYCGHAQKESAHVLSTYCRGCSEHLKVVNGVPLADRPKVAGPSFTDSSGSRAREPRPVPPLESPAVELPAMPAPPRQDRPETPETPAPALAGQMQEIQCSNCGHLHRVSPGASTSYCPRCGEEESLHDLRINRAWNRPIRTRGDVVITPNGAVGAVPVRCANLFIEGVFAGDAECRGDLVMRASGCITGRICCRRLLIEEGAEVKFTNPVDAREVRIDGRVRGEIICPGRIVLEEHARLHGDIRARALVVKTGARHSGSVKVPA